VTDNTDEKRITAAQRIHERARYFRGRFLNHVAVIERDIALILTNLVSTTDATQRVRSRAPLAANKTVLLEVVERDYPRYWEQNKEVLSWLDDIIAFRNKLAHSVVDVSERALSRPIESGIGFVDWNDGTPITDQQSEDWEVKANMVSTCLEEIKRLLPFKEKPN
jgi:hypothetical protein